MKNCPVTAKIETLNIPTHPVGQPEKFPLFFEKRVYQGSSGKLYPVPFVDKVFDESEDTPYISARLENQYVKLIMLPEIGGRIFLGQDKANRDYDFFYRQDVIKPALVGLAGPWLSGGVEFNWPQHHRPGTFMPADCFVEEEDDGVRTIWFSEHDPLNRLKGMHGIRLRPDNALIECRVRLYNRTPFTQSFLWWANVAARVHDQYQSFFPPDVNYVADHAGRAMSSFPQANNPYYGVPYANYPDANDLTWYKNIPVPTSYMVCNTQYDFFGGYDYDAQGGFVHVANRHISPGKKQWTWGNHEFGWAWDRELTDHNGAYIELMAGVYTDNQPDFSYLLPYETKTFSQYWWPYQKLGPVQFANEQFAIRLTVDENKSIDFGVCTSSQHHNLKIILKENDQTQLDIQTDLSPDNPYQSNQSNQNKNLSLHSDCLSALSVQIIDKNGNLLLSYRPGPQSKPPQELPSPAQEPVAPQEAQTIEELYLIGEHLEQYRHPTRAPELYWQEALRRDPKDLRCNLALGKIKLKAALPQEAAQHFATAIARLSTYHKNVVTGEAHYYHGVALKCLNDLENLERAYAFFYKSTWNFEWRSAAYYQLATLDCHKQDWQKALEHLEASLSVNQDNNKAHVLKAFIYHQTNQSDKSTKTLQALLQKDPLDHWARFESLAQETFESKQAFINHSRNDAQTLLDIIFDYADAGLYDRALQAVQFHFDNEITSVPVPNPMQRSPMITVVKAWLEYQSGQKEAGENTLKAITSSSFDYFFPSRTEEYHVLDWALHLFSQCSDIPYALGNFCYNQKRHHDAIGFWEKSIETNPNHVISLRNLGIAYWNIKQDGERACHYYEKAWSLDSNNSRLLFEYDQLRKKLNHPPQDRLELFLENKTLVMERDDCCVELATLYNQLDQPQNALDLLLERRFHPWEGGEGKVVRQFTQAHLLLGQKALKDNQPETAVTHLENALKIPQNLGEAYHLHQAKADVNYWLGKAFQAQGDQAQAKAHFQACLHEKNDFQDMAVKSYSELTYFKGLALLELSQKKEALQLFEELKNYAESLREQPAKIDYFATSLPNLLVFEEDLDLRQQQEADILKNLSLKGIQACQA